MGYDEELAARVRGRLSRHRGVTERPMFGGLSFSQGGNLAVCVRGDGLLVRVGDADADTALARPGTAPFATGDRTMRGWVLVSAGALVDDVALNDWVDEGHAFAAGLPPK